MCERFPGYTFAALGEETLPQLLAKLRYIERHPAPVVFIGEPR